MTLRDTIKADSQKVFLQLADFAEEIVYRPRGGGDRTINAIVDREPVAIYDAAGNMVLPEVNIHVDNNCKTGIAASEVDTGGDLILMTVRDGDTIPRTLAVMRIIGHDEGIVQLALK